MHACMNGDAVNSLQVVAALLLLQALAAGWTGNGTVLLQPRLKLLVMRFILQAASMMSASILRQSTWVIPVLEAGLWRFGQRQRVGQNYMLRLQNILNRGRQAGRQAQTDRQTDRDGHAGRQTDRQRRPCRQADKPDACCSALLADVGRRSGRSASRTCSGGTRHSCTRGR